MRAYEYDALSRLEVARATNDLTPCLDQNGAAPDCWRQKFGYDRFGNRTLLGGAGGTTYPAALDAANNPAVSPATNRITSPGYSYDAAGNLLCDPLRPCAQGQSSLVPYYTYDAEGRMRAAGAAASYTYDGVGRRVRKQLADGEATVFVYRTRWAGWWPSIRTSPPAAGRAT